MATEAEELRKGPAGISSAAATGYCSGGQGDSPVACRTIGGASGIAGRWVKPGRPSSLFTIGLAMGWAPGVVAGSIGCGPRGGTR